MEQGLCSRVLHQRAQKFPSYLHWQSKVFWDVMLHHWVCKSKVLRDNSAFIFSDKQSKNKLILFGLVGPEDEGTIVLWSVTKYMFNDAVSYPRSLESLVTLLWEPQIMHTYLYSFPIHDCSIHLEDCSLDRTWWWQLCHTNIDGIWALVVQHNNLLVLIHFLLFLIATQCHILTFPSTSEKILPIRRRYAKLLHPQLFLG